MRRRKLILENKIIKPETSGFYIGNHGRFTTKIFSNVETFQPFEPLRSNRFIVDLEIDSNSLYKKIPNSRIGGFKFVSSKSGENIEIESMLSIDEWIDEFLKANICKLYIVDAIGKIIKMFDYDIVNIGYQYELNYENSEVIKPKFLYKII
jgi:hypothetical protein